MDAMRFAVFIVSAALLGMLLRRMRPGAGTALVMAAGIMMLLSLLPAIRQVLGDMATLADESGLNSDYTKQLLKVGGISLAMDFAAQTCRDAGEDGLAVKAELAGRVMLLALALPFMQALLGQILSLAS